MRTNYKSRELENVFGDSRLEARHQKLVLSLSQGFGESLSHKEWSASATKGMYRFFANEQVTPEKQLRSSQKEVENVLKTQKRILHLTDTTEFDYTGKRNEQELGQLNYTERRGMQLHSSLLTDTTGVPISILGPSYHTRTLGAGKKSRDEDFETKESYRWKEHMDLGSELAKQNPDCEILYVADREADRIELFQARTEPNHHFIIRSLHNRKLAENSGKLFEALERAPFGAIVWVQATHPSTGKPRPALVEIRFLPVVLQQNRKIVRKTHRTKISLFAILAKEINAPDDVSPILWRLITTLPMESAEDAVEFTRYYALRWVQERFHFLLKSGGANVESFQLKNLHRLKNAITCSSMAALNALKIHFAAKNQPEMPAFDLGVTSPQYQALCFYINHMAGKPRLDPNIPPSIAVFAINLASIVGFKPSKTYPIPGLKILNRALLKLEIIAEVFNMHPN